MQTIKDLWDVEFLSRCSPESAYRWLEERAHKKDMLGDSAPDQALFSRNEPLIQYGLARFSGDSKIVESLFLQGDEGIRLAALSNWHALYFGIPCTFWITPHLPAIVASTNAKLILALGSNPRLDGDTLLAMLRKEGVFQALTEDQYISAFFGLKENKRLVTLYDDTILDGWAEHRHNQFFYDIWLLAETLPPTQDMGSLLELLFRKLSTIRGAIANPYKDIQAVLTRWRLPNEEDTRKSIGPLLTGSIQVRSYVAGFIKQDEDLLNSGDQALRMAGYRRFNPESHKDWGRWAERDGAVFFEEAFENPRIWQTPWAREQLERAAWELPDPNSDMDAPNHYRWAAKRFHEQHPEWFDDEEIQDSNPRHMSASQADLDALKEDLTEHLEAMNMVLDNIRQSVRASVHLILPEVYFVGALVAAIVTLPWAIENSRWWWALPIGALFGPFLIGKLLTKLFTKI